MQNLKETATEKSEKRWKVNNKIIVSNTSIFYYLTYRQNVSFIRPSSGILYIKFNTGYM